MAATRIEWTDRVWNVMSGCSYKSDGCDRCYARRMSKRLAGRFGYPQVNPFAVTLHPERLIEPFNWKKSQRVFVCSMGDLFHDDVPVEYIWAVFQTMAKNPQHTFQVLTKRPSRASSILGSLNFISKFSEFPLRNVWFGVTCENRFFTDERLSILAQIPAAIRFVSFEPLLGEINLCDIAPNFMGLDWVIVGAETGPKKRHMEESWALGLRNQCKTMNVSFFFKKNSEGTPILDGDIYREFPNKKG